MSDQNNAEASTEKSGWKAPLLICSGIAALLVVVSVSGINAPPKKSPAERIDAACQEQFGAEGEAAVNECRLSLYADNIAEGARRAEAAQEQKLDAARRAAQ